MSNLIYIINCSECGLQYIGETKRPLRQRMYEHFKSVRNYTNQPQCLDISLVQIIPCKIWNSLCYIGWRMEITQITKVAVEAKNYFIFGPSPPCTQQALIYLCEIVSSYCTPNPGANFIFKNKSLHNISAL